MTTQKHKPKRKRDTLTLYQFNQDNYYVTLTIQRRGRSRYYSLFDTSYARFVALANSGNYQIKIRQDTVVGWVMYRKLIACEHGYFTACFHGCDPNGTSACRSARLSSRSRTMAP